MEFHQKMIELNCPKCGGRISENDKFCRHCGTKFGHKERPITVGLFDTVLKWGENWLKGSVSSRMIGASVLILIVAGITEVGCAFAGRSSIVAEYMIIATIVALFVSFGATLVETEFKERKLKIASKKTNQSQNK